MARTKRQSAGGKGTRGLLSVRDHTTIVKATVENIEALRTLLRGTRKPSGPVSEGTV